MCGPGGSRTPPCEVRLPCSPPRLTAHLPHSSWSPQFPKCLSSQKTSSLLSGSDREDPLGALYVATVSVFVDGETEAGGWQVSQVEPGGT